MLYEKAAERVLMCHHRAAAKQGISLLNEHESDDDQRFLTQGVCVPAHDTLHTSSTHL